MLLSSLLSNTIKKHYIPGEFFLYEFTCQKYSLPNVVKKQPANLPDKYHPNWAITQATMSERFCLSNANELCTEQRYYEHLYAAHIAYIRNYELFFALQSSPDTLT
jgi:hypothetical protein